MATIYQYQKVIDKFTTHALREPDYEQLETEDRVVELCTIDGITYVSVPDAVTIPDQPEEISRTLRQVTMTNELKKRILNRSPVIAYINTQVRKKIQEDVEQSEELRLMRNEINRIRQSVNIMEDSDYKEINDKILSHRQWGTQRKNELGFS